MGLFPARCGGCTARDAYYDRPKLAQAMRRFHEDFLPDDTDMAAVRHRFRGFACFGGNISGALLATGTPEDVGAYVRELLATVAGDGGFVLGTGTIVDEAPVENVRALMEAGRKYGG